MTTTFSLPVLSSNATIVDANGYPTTAFLQWWSQNRTAITAAITAIQQIPEIQTALVAAQQAAASAQAAATAAQTAANNAQSTANSATTTSKLTNSGISPLSVLTATPNIIRVAAHKRIYADGSTVQVNAGTVSATQPGDVDYVYYQDDNFLGGSVTYQVSDLDNPVQANGIHVVGAVTIPTTGTATGGDGPAPPGTVSA